MPILAIFAPVNLTVHLRPRHRKTAHMWKVLTLGICLFSLNLAGQQASLSGQVTDATGEGVPFATLKLLGSVGGTIADADGWYTFTELAAGTYKAEVSAIGFSTRRISVTLAAAEQQTLNFTLEQTGETLSQVVVTGTMKAVSRANSPVPVEVYSANFFRANPAPSVFESLQNVNGVRPQLNCAVCNTGDIHINGLEGPYTMVLIDGMPIVSGLSTVYGLTGIPQQMIARTEVVKGPASTLYGSEAVGGLINVITRSPEDAYPLSIDMMVSGWGEVNTDLGLKAKVGKLAQTYGLVHLFREPDFTRL